eukprot:364647-Chlamydomonas_euryale.AAC.18
MLACADLTPLCLAVGLGFTLLSAFLGGLGWPFLAWRSGLATPKLFVQFAAALHQPGSCCALRQQHAAWRCHGQRASKLAPRLSGPGGAVLSRRHSIRGRTWCSCDVM